MSPKTVLITGCSDGGIGSALALKFQKRGYHVFATTRSVAKMTQLKDLPNVTLLALDVTQQESIERGAEAVKAHTGGTLDVLVNNSGAAYSIAAIDADMSQLQSLFAVNFFGTVATTQAFMPLIIAAQGTVVNICSTAASMNAPWMGMYAASKAAQLKFSESLRLEMRAYNVRVMAVNAGAVETQIAFNQALPDPTAGAYFQPTKEEKEKMKNGGSFGSGMSADVFADKVVGDVVNGKSGITWRGKHGNLVWFLSFLPNFITDTVGWQVLGGRFEKAQ